MVWVLLDPFHLLFLAHSRSPTSFVILFFAPQSLLTIASILFFIQTSLGQLDSIDIGLLFIYHTAVVFASLDKNQKLLEQNRGQAKWKMVCVQLKESDTVRGKQKKKSKKNKK
jgi:hypothetical protein